MLSTHVGTHNADHKLLTVKAKIALRGEKESAGAESRSQRMYDKQTRLSFSESIADLSHYSALVKALAKP